MTGRLRAWLAGLLCVLVAGFPVGAMAVGVEAPVRALHLVIRSVSVGDIEARVDLAASQGYNLLVLALADGVAFEHFPGRLREEIGRAHV